MSGKNQVCQQNHRWCPRMETMRVGASLPAVVLLFALLFLGGAVESSSGKQWKPKVPAMFIFGDSLVDVGNNNYITGFPLLPLANFVPYGQTYFHKPTGRWSDGRLIVDFIAQHLSLPFPKPYLMPGSDPTRFKRGVNFASAGSGILDETFLWQGVINLSVQVENYLKAVAELKKGLGDDETSEILRESLYIFVTGNNDVSEYVANTTLQAKYSVEQFVSLLVTKLATDIEIVMDSGARKIVIGGMGPVGCVPRVLALTGSKGPCLEISNTISRQIDAGLLTYVNGMNMKTNTTNVILATTYEPLDTIIENGTSLGFTSGINACCGSGAYGGLSPPCGVGNYTICRDVKKYIYWDFTHLTERAYQILADAIWSGDKSSVLPVNLRHLAAS